MYTYDGLDIINVVSCRLWVINRYQANNSIETWEAHEYSSIIWDLHPEKPTAMTSISCSHLIHPSVGALPILTCHGPGVIGVTITHHGSKPEKMGM